MHSDQTISIVSSRVIAALCAASASFLFQNCHAEQVTTAPSAASAPELAIVKVTIYESKPWCHYFFNCPDEKGATLAAPVVSNQLIGSGDLSVDITNKSFVEAGAYADRAGKSLRLFLNGVDLASDAVLMATEPVDSTNAVRLKFHIAPGSNSQKLWATLYRTVGLTKPNPLHVDLGWDTIGLRSVYQGDTSTGNEVSVTTKPAQRTAIGLVVAIFLAFVLAGWKTDMLRDKSFPTWWADANTLRNKLLTLPGGNTTAYVKGKYDFYDPANDVQYKAAAQAVIDDMRLGNYDSIAVEDEPKTIIGAALLGATWNAPKVIRSSFSLARVQVAIWFLFSIASGIFLWIVYGQLAPLDGSVLILLGISTTTAGAAIAVDPQGKKFFASQGFFTDLVTDSDNRYQIHRLQAVVVNVVLVFVGLRHVTGELTYPVFDASWLAFLGISGATYAAGKQLVEPKK